MSTVICAVCETARPASEVYKPVRHVDEVRCIDTDACRIRCAYRGDPVGQVTPNPPPAVPGAACSICAAVDPPGGVYHRGGGAVYACLDRPGCTQRAAADMSPWTDGSPDRVIAETAGHLRLPAARQVEIPLGRIELDPDELAARAAQEALGRRAGGTSTTTAA